MARYSGVSKETKNEIDMANHLKIKENKCISPSASHAAFTDLFSNPFNNGESLLCCYRQASNHVSPDGVIIIVNIALHSGHKVFQRLRLPQWDLRDPKFCFDGRRLIVTAYAKKKDPTTGQVTTKMVSAFTTTGESWSTLHSFGTHGWWLWRFTWHKNTAYGFAYNRGSQRIDLYKGDPTKRMFIQKKEVLSLEKHAAGYPNESHIIFDQNDKATAIVRRDADTFTAKMGFASPPYTQWQWHDLGRYIGGPVMFPLCKDYLIISGRDWNGRSLTTKIWLLSLQKMKLTELLTLPSKGDSSYPGIVRQNDTLYLSYYSSHIDNNSRVYLVTISGVNELLNVIKQGQI